MAFQEHPDVLNPTSTTGAILSACLFDATNVLIINDGPGDCNVSLGSSDVVATSTCFMLKSEESLCIPRTDAGTQFGRVGLRAMSVLLSATSTAPSAVVRLYATGF